MNKSKAILKTLRLPNLVMLVVVQFIVSHFIMEFYYFSFHLLIAFCTVFIALGGYLMNDIQDIQIDTINNKLGWINDSNKRQATIFAILCHIFGLILGFTACYLSDLSFFPWFIGSSLALVVYAYFLSNYKILGNILISALIALAIFLPYVLGANYIHNTYEYDFIGIDIFIYAALAFLLNWTREVCKDIEDINGDSIYQRSSIPIVSGIPISKVFIGFILSGFICLSIFTAYIHEVFSLFLVFLLAFLSCNILCFIILLKTKEAKEFHKLSRFLKILMLIGLFLPVALHLSL